MLTSGKRQQQQQKNKNKYTDLENKLMVTRGEGNWGGIVREFGIDMYTLLYLKWITNKTYCIAQGLILNIL